jgi:excisionase family DNA binding protein
MDKDNNTVMEREDPRRNKAHSSDATDGDNGEHLAEGSGWTTTKQAAKALGVSRRTVQGYVRRGLLEAVEQGSGVEKTFYVSIDSLNALLDRRRQEDEGSPQIEKVSRTRERAENVGEGLGETLRRLAERLEARTAEAAELRVRLELTERTETTLREELERESRQHREDLQDLQRERDARLAAQERAEQLEANQGKSEEEARRSREELEAKEEEAERLREELDAERGKGFFRRLFGG